MIFVTGGAFQGKEAFVREHFKINSVVSAGELENDPAAEALFWNGGEIDCILQYHRIVRGQTARGEDVLAKARELLLKNPDVIITMDETGCGVVPMERIERDYREQAGRAAAYFAEEAEMVYRLVCGIAQRIK